MKARQRDYHPYIDSYMDDIRSGKIPASKEIMLAMDLVESELNKPDVFIDNEKINKAAELIERYFRYKLLNWELFVLALVHCYFKKEDIVVFREFFIEMGRGNGKNGFISPLAWYLSTHYHGVRGYNIDIIANSEDQAETSFKDIYEVLEDTWEKSKKFFTKTKQLITNLKTKSNIKYNTSNARTKDGKRSACLIFDEVHEYKNWKTINVFRSGFGKRRHSRIFYITTNGYVRMGVIDDLLEKAQKVLSGEIKGLRFLPLIYKLDKKEEADNPELWIKANPSLPYLPLLQEELNHANIERKHDPEVAKDFYTKRMDLPAEDAYVAVATWEKILATKQPIPYEELKGMQCVGAFDYAEINDFASCGLWFKYKGKRIWIEHSFVCHKALELESRPINFPVQEMVDRGLMTIVYGDTITPAHIAGWFLEQAKLYNIVVIVGDRFRVTLVESEFQKEGLPLKTVPSGPATHAKVAPLISSLFAEENLVFGDSPPMRWYVNNTYKELDPKGNTSYLKIEPRTRKTDGFFAMVHATTQDGELQEYTGDITLYDVYTF